MLIGSEVAVVVYALAPVVLVIGIAVWAVVGGRKE